MISKEAIDSALVAHSQWKKRLQDAIDNGKSQFQVGTVKKDDACQFGQWLYSLPEEIKSTPDFQNIKNLHSEFHKTAGEILELAITGKVDEAHHKLEPGGGYGRISGKLVLALSNWKDQLK